jgi:hypothetical protein
MQARLRIFAPALAALWLIFAGPPAWAHDTWFDPRPSARPGEVVLALGTGNQFPQQEFPVGVASLRKHGCRSGEAEVVKLAAWRDTRRATIVGADLGHHTAGSAITCWAQLMPFEIELAPDKIELYLKEIRPPQSVLDTWAEMRSRGLAWKERYTKHARIELPGSALPAAPRPVAMGMDVLLESGLQTIRPGDPLVFRVLRDGAPLPGFSVELRSDRSRFGLWRKTDSEGRIHIEAPLAGKWVLRGTDLRLSDSAPDTWESRFVTLAFEIAADQNGSSLKLNTRSASQMPAMPAISSEPLTKTSR